MDYVGNWYKVGTNEENDEFPTTENNQVKGEETSEAKERVKREEDEVSEEEKLAVEEKAAAEGPEVAAEEKPAEFSPVDAQSSVSRLVFVVFMNIYIYLGII